MTANAVAEALRNLAAVERALRADGPTADVRLALETVAADLLALAAEVDAG